MNGMCRCEGPGFTNDKGPIPHTPGSPRCLAVPLDPAELSGMNAYRRIAGLFNEASDQSRPAVVVPTDDLRTVLRLARRTLFPTPEQPSIPAPEG